MDETTWCHDLSHGITIKGYGGKDTCRVCGALVSPLSAPRRVAVSRVRESLGLIEYALRVLKDHSGDPALVAALVDEQARLGDLLAVCCAKERPRG